MKEQNRRDFIKMAALAGGAAAVGGCATSTSSAPAIAGDMAFGVLLHLGVHMWGGLDSRSVLHSVIFVGTDPSAEAVEKVSLG